MACVCYDVKCKSCNEHDYVRYKPTNCEKCGSENISIVVDWDEHQDHNED